MSDLTKAEKLARAMDNVRSGGRDFNSQLAAQVSQELRAQNERIAGLESWLQSALDWASWHRDHPRTINHNAILFDLRAREFLAKIEGATND